MTVLTSAQAFDLATRKGTKYGIDPGLLASIWFVESGFNTTIAGDSGASIGLGQLYRAGGAGSGYSVKELQNPELNADISARYLAGLMQQFPDRQDLAIRAYNAGAAGVLSGVNNQSYLEKVEGAYDSVWRTEFGPFGPMKVAPGGTIFDPLGPGGRTDNSGFSSLEDICPGPGEEGVRGFPSLEGICPGPGEEGVRHLTPEEIAVEREGLGVQRGGIANRLRLGLQQQSRLRGELGTLRRADVLGLGTRQAQTEVTARGAALSRTGDLLRANPFAALGVV